MFIRAGNVTTYIPTSSNHNSTPTPSCEEQYEENTVAYNDCVAERETLNAIGGWLVLGPLGVLLAIIIWVGVMCVKG